MAVEEYREIIKNLILEKAQRRFTPEEIEAQAVIAYLPHPPVSQSVFS